MAATTLPSVSSKGRTGESGCSQAVVRQGRHETAEDELGALGHGEEFHRDGVLGFQRPLAAGIVLAEMGVHDVGPDGRHIGGKGVEKDELTADTIRLAGVGVAEAAAQRGWSSGIST